MSASEEGTVQALATARQNGNPPSTASSTFAEKLKVIKPFWVSDQKGKARLMLAGIIGLTILEIAVSVGIGFGFEATINALVSKNVTSFAINGALSVAGLFSVNIASSQRQYLTDVLTLNWRGWLTQQFNKAWLHDRSYFKLQQGPEQKQNPDQRIAENVPAVADQTLGLTLGLFRSTLSLTAFSLVLWNLSPLMLAAAAGCAVVASAATLKIGKPLQKTIAALQHCEARFRHALVRVKDNAKAIALADMAPIEEKTLLGKFNGIAAERHKLYKYQRKLRLFITFNAQSSTIIPIALAAPQFFYGTATMGSLELMRQAYTQVYASLSWFIEGYPLIVNWATNTNQLISFWKALQDSKEDMLAIKPAEKAPFPPPPPAIQPAMRLL